MVQFKQEAMKMKKENQTATLVKVTEINKPSSNEYSSSKVSEEVKKAAENVFNRHRGAFQKLYDYDKSKKD